MNWNNYYAGGGDFGRLSDGAVDFIASFAKGGTALDVGCGTGYLARQLAVRGFSVTGLDPSDEAIKRARSEDAAGTYHIGEITAVSGTFDLVTCKHVYAFISDKPAFLRNVKSRLKPNGIFALLTPTMDRVEPTKVGIAVDRSQLMQELGGVFEVIAQRELPGGLLLICR